LMKIDGERLLKPLQDLGLDIRGYYEDKVITVSNKDDFLVNSFMEVRVLEENYDDADGNTTYAVIERQLLEHGKESHHAVIKNVPKFANTLYRSKFITIISVPTTMFQEFADHLQFNYEITLIPRSSIHIGIRPEILPIIESIYANITEKLVAPVPKIQDLIGYVASSNLKFFTTYLTGEDPSSTILTRNSYSQGALEAANWIEAQFRSFGLSTFQQPFRNGWCPNVIGIKQGVSDPSKIVVVGAHYDSRGPSVSSPTQRAPGANDNASGTGAVLQFAKAIFESKATFAYTIHFIVFGGEEQGLIGSAAYAKTLANEKAVVIAMLNSDMIGFRVPSEQYQCSFPSLYTNPSLTMVAQKVVNTYVPSLVVGSTQACCSDHQSFFYSGFPATAFFERNGRIADPMYHESGDLVNRVGYDVDGQYPMITQAVLATLATVAEITVA